MAMPKQLARAKRRNYKRPRFEELPSIDARWLARHDMVPRDWSRRTYDFSFIDPRFRGLVITARDCEIIFPDGGQQTVAIHWQAIEGMCQGTMRPLFGCPCCGHHCFKLFDLHGELYCKRCAAGRGAVYASQLQSAKGRALLQSHRLRRFLDEYPNCTAIHRAPWMQHRTYKRLLNRLRQLEARSPDMRRRKRKAKPFTRTTLRPVTMYKTRIASIAMG
jgi:hypothetical protein